MSYNQYGFAQLNCGSLPVFNTTVFSNQTLQNVTFTNQTIHFIGNATIIGTVTMTDCQVLIDPNVVINVNNNALTPTTLSIIGTNTNGNFPSIVQGCGTMWRSIVVNAGAAIRIQNSTVSDGQQAIVLNPGFNNAGSVITGSTFRRNIWAITADDPTNTALYPVTLQTFSGNTFTGQTGSVAFLPPFASPQPLYGLRLNSISGSLGTAGAQNVFSGFSAAILLTNASLSLNNCRFISNSYQDWNGIQTGIGILSDNSSLTIQNIYSNNASCEFYNNTRGIRSSRTNLLTVRNAIFGSTAAAGLGNQARLDIEVIQSTRPWLLDISTNTFNVGTPIQNSVYVERPPMAGGIHTRVQSNIINMPSPAVGQGQLANNLRLFEFSARAGAVDQAVVADNIFTITYGGANLLEREISAILITDNAQGISGGDNYQVSGNTISYLMPGVSPPQNNGNGTHNGIGVGIILNNAIGNIIGPNNTATSTLFPPPVAVGFQSWIRCGVHVQASPNVLVCTNTSNNCQFGFHFVGNCTGGEWGRNTMGSSMMGLAMSNVIYPNQDYRMNVWTPGSTYLNLSAWLGFGSNTGGNWNVDNTNPALGYLPPSSGWFVNLANNNQSQTTCDGVLPPPPFVNDGVEKLMAGGFNFSSAVDSWDFERSLLERMIRFPSEFSNNTNVQNWYNGKVNTSIWKFAKSARMLEDAFVFTAGQQQSVTNLLGNQLRMLDSLGQIEVLEGADQTSTTPQLQSAKGNILTRLASNQLQLKTLTESNASQQLPNVQNAETFINNLSGTNSIEANFKLIMQLKAKAILGTEWSVSEWANLRTLANSCQLTGGEAVLHAREMLPAPERFTYSLEGDETHCTTERGSEKGQSGLNDSNELVIWPNPADQSVDIGFAHPFTGSVEIMDLNGRVVAGQMLTEGVRQSFQTTSLPSGLYLIRTVDAQSHIKISKVSIFH
jgi:Secretion system C-terminal sorting domain